MVLIILNMKNHHFFKAILTSMMLFATLVVSAQEQKGFKKIDVKEDFTENGFQWFRDAEILAAGNKEKHNAMTIGWGGIGTLWGRTALTVYVAEKRYTKQFMDKAQFDESMNLVLDETRVFGELYSDGYVPKIYIVNPDGSYKLYVSLDNKIDAIKSEIAALLDGKNVEP